MLSLADETISAVEIFIKSTKTVLEAMPDLQDQQFRCEQALRDIEHYVENNKVNRTQSAQLIREMAKYRHKRREIKDTLETLELLATYFQERREVWAKLDSRLGQAKNIRKKVSADRLYRPRVLYGLFGQEEPQTVISLAMIKAQRE